MENGMEYGTENGYGMNSKYWFLSSKLKLVRGLTTRFW